MTWPADFSAGIGRGMDVDVVYCRTRSRRPGRRSASRCLRPGWCRRSGSQRRRRRSCRLRRGPVEVGGGGGAGEAGIGHLPAQLLGGGIIVDVGGVPVGGGGVSAALRIWRPAWPCYLSANAGPARATEAANARVGENGFLVMACSLSLLTSDDDTSLQTRGFGVYSRNRPSRRTTFGHLMAVPSDPATHKVRTTMTVGVMLRRIFLLLLIARRRGGSPSMAG